jgi:histidyl-tRNA synthetase
MMTGGRVKGVRDFIGREAVLRQLTLQKIRETYEAFGFEPLETPILEYLSLFTDKSGPEIENQLYSFEDKKGEKLALRPEQTVSRLRVITENKSISKPLKAYGIGNVWRYEDTSKGRYREFMQADVDVYGSSSIAYDAEVIACVDAALKNVGITGYKISLNNRKVLRDTLDSIGIGPLKEAQALRELDKIDKIGKEAVLDSLSSLVGKDKAIKIIEFLEGKYKVKSEGDKELNELINYLKKYGISNFQIDNSLVRGLAYYDGNIFEFIVKTPQYSGTIAGGGRYDKLSQKFGVSLPVVGMAIGFERIMDILKEAPTEDFTERYCVLNIDNIDKAIEVASKLRKKGNNTDILLDGSSLSKGLSYCSAKGIRYAVIVGNKDLQKGEVTIRDLKEKKDSKVKETEL